MAEIDNAQLTAYANGSLRVIADQLAKIDADIAGVLEEYAAKDLGTVIEAAGASNLIADGSEQRFGLDHPIVTGEMVDAHRSSNVHSFGYDIESAYLYIRYLGYVRGQRGPMAERPVVARVRSTDTLMSRPKNSFRSWPLIARANGSGTICVSAERGRATRRNTNWSASKVDTCHERRLSAVIRRAVNCGRC